MTETVRGGPRRSLLALTAGFTLWAAAFVALYGGLSVGCEFGWERMELAAGISLQRAMLVVLFILSLAGGALVIRCAHSRLARAEAPERRFLERVGLLAGWAALVSSFVTFAPVFFLSTCT